MASKSFPHKNVFNTGEVSDRFASRTDVGKYYSALKRLINFLPFTQGGVTRRPALRFGINNFCDLEGRIIPFKFTRDIDSNFLIHLCDERLHITDDNGDEIIVGPLEMLCEETTDSDVFFDTADITTTCAFLNCTDVTPHVNFKAQGGTPPYSWGIVGPVPPPLLVVTGVNSELVTVFPPVNTPSVSGPAYRIQVREQNTNASDNCPPPDSDCFCQVAIKIAFGEFRCDGTLFGNVGQGACPDAGTTPPCLGGPFVSCTTVPIGVHNNSAAKISCCPSAPLHPCAPFDAKDTFFCTVCSGAGGPTDQVKVANARGVGNVCDIRTAPMIAAGCAPCYMSVDGSILTVTDALGVMVSVTLNAQFGS